MSIEQQSAATTTTTAASKSGREEKGVATYSDEVDRAVSENIENIKSTNRSVELAEQFAKNFLPTGQQYAWLIPLAKEQHASALKTFDDIDAKASSLASFFGGISGFLSIVTFASQSLVRPNTSTLVSASLALLAATSTVIFAVIARQISGFYVPNVRSAARYAQDLPETGELAFVGQWVYATALTDASCRKKAWWLGYATWLSVLTIALLCLTAIISFVSAK